MRILAALLFCSLLGAGVRSYEGTLEIPTYEHSARETEPPLFAGSTVTGMYPFTTYLMPFEEGGPRPRTYRALFVENEYLKLTYIPEFGGRIFSLYDKLRGREVFYRNDVIRPAAYNPRNSWPQSGMELTGPHDLHMLTLHGEPFWANRIVPQADGALSLVLGEFDPVYGMKVNFTATLHPGIAALEIGVFCFNTRAARMPQMLWVNTAISATEKTRFIYPMSRTVGHTTADIADWPLYNGVDYSWDRNNRHMLGVFGIDSYDNFQGAYQFDRDYGIFRWADRRIVQGMKLWTFGYGDASKSHEAGYTDHAGPYVELQSGRHVWDGHYEWVPPHQVESWNEWWVPVAGTNGLTTLTRDIALSVTGTDVALATTRVISGATVVVRGAASELLRRTVDFTPDKPFRAGIPAATGVTVTNSAGQVLLDYRRPAESPGRKEYTPFTRPLEQPRKAPEEMGVEELALAAEFKFKELDSAGAVALLEKALARDPGYSRAHLLLGIQQFTQGRHAEAVTHLEKAIERDPYSGEAYYYLAMAQFASGQENRAERNLYFIWPGSGYYGAREYYLGRLDLLRKNTETAAAHFRRALEANGRDLASRFLLAVALRQRGEREAARAEIDALQRLDPTSALAQAERFFLTGDQAELIRLMGGQSQEAIAVSGYYRDVARWSEAARIMRLVEQNNRDPFGTPPEFYYTLAYCLRRAGDAGADAALAKAQTMARNVDRFPYREESEAPLAEAVRLNPRDALAHYLLGCLLHYRQRPAEAIKHWEAAVEINPRDFSSRRALGLAYSEQGAGVEKAAAQLEKAVELNPAHIRTLNDLSAMYARAGRFDAQLTVLQNALARSPKDDDLAEGVLTAFLTKGRYQDAVRLIDTHTFAPRHRTYSLRGKYRLMRYAMAAQAFNRGDFSTALQTFTAALRPPVSLGMDDFQSQASPRAQYYLGLTLEALGRTQEAREAYQKCVAGAAQLSGDRDSWNSENFFIVPALERLGRTGEAATLRQRFENFARGEVNAKAAGHRAEANYLLALVEQSKGNGQQAQTLMVEAVKALPDFLPARLEMRGDVPRPR